MQLFSWWSDFNSSEFYKLFLKCAQPRRWKAFDGKITEMDTQNSLRGKELLEIYHSINIKNIPKDERISVLLTLKWTVKVRFSFLFMFSLKLYFPKVLSLHYVDSLAVLLLADKCHDGELETLMYYLVCECNLNSRYTLNSYFTLSCAYLSSGCVRILTLWF